MASPLDMPLTMSSNEWNRTRTHPGEGIVEAGGPVARGALGGSGGSGSFGL